MDRSDSPSRQVLPDLPDDSLFDDPMMPSGSDGSTSAAATTGTGAMSTPVGSGLGASRTGAGLSGVDDPTGEQAFLASLSGVPGADALNRTTGTTNAGAITSGATDNLSRDGAGLDAPDHRAQGTGSTDTSDSSSGSGLSMPDPGEAVSAIKTGGGQAMSQATGWVKEHPLAAIGIGLIGGIVLGSRGGEQHHHHHYGAHGSTDGEQHSQTAQGQSGQGIAGGLMQLAQRTGLLDTMTTAADRAVQVVNEQAGGMLRQYIPGFDDHLMEKRSAPSPVSEHSASRVTGQLS